jgi:hypothetical protein
MVPTRGFLLAFFLSATLTTAVARASEPLFPRLSNAEAWASLPKADSGGTGTLPNWARATVKALPRTTAAMLELDRLHRTKSPLGPVLRGKMRWVAADANRCEYSRATAEADLRRAGVNDAEIAALQGGPDRWAAADRNALDFALRMTVDAGAITDPEVAAVKREYGEEKLVAMVLLLASANFQDRILLTLAVALEDEGALPPLEVRWASNATAPPVPPRSKRVDQAGPPIPNRVDDPTWGAEDFDILQKKLETQRGNDGRIRVPSYEDVLRAMPPDYPRPKAPVRIKWSLVCMGYQPELAAAWSACTSRFREEAKQDRVFEESLFWVVTRTIHCFY